MKKNNSNQKAGNNAKQFQIATLNVGVTQEEVRNIIKSENELMLVKSKIIASEIAQKRLDDYAEVLIPKLVKSELLSAFNDPEIQVLFKKTEYTAICTERKTDYEMLSELLIHKINKKDDYLVSAAIEKAISEVNNISVEALMVLTLIFSIITYVPTSGKIRDGLKALDDLYSHLLEYFDLPTTNDWKENLEIVNAIKTFDFGSSKTLEDIFFESFKGYSTMGLKLGSEQYDKAIKRMLSVGLPRNILIKNEMDEDYVRIGVLNKSNIDNLSLKTTTNGNCCIEPLTKEQKSVLIEIYDSYDLQNDNTKEKFINILNEFNDIKKVMEWWDKNIVNYSLELTAIGKVLACTNAVRIDSSLPNTINKKV